jgi:hypothetical protein
MALWAVLALVLYVEAVPIGDSDSESPAKIMSSG